jgi:hypothetical protein
MSLVERNSNSQFDVPILFLIFRRPHTTEKVFEKIKKVKPPKLYIAADGPRDWVPGEAEKVQATRKYVLDNIDWECEVKTLFRDKNLGCGKAVSEAINWFFENEEKGIILEDDTVPSLSFFSFCKILLEKYKDEKKVWHISACNFMYQPKNDGDYFFSALPFIWGWATWATRWKYYDFEMKNFNDDVFIKNYWKGLDYIYWKKIFLKMKNKEIDTWDYQWCFTIWFYKALAVSPRVNMVENIGFGELSTHILKKTFKVELMAKDMEIKKHPSGISRDIEADRYFMKNVFLPKEPRGFIGLITYGTKIGKILQKIGLTKF